MALKSNRTQSHECFALRLTAGNRKTAQSSIIIGWMVEIRNARGTKNHPFLDVWGLCVVTSTGAHHLLDSHTHECPMLNI